MLGAARRGDVAPRRSRFRWIVCGLLFLATLGLAEGANFPAYLLALAAIHALLPRLEPMRLG
jgi:hypothetical protein